MAGVAHTPYLEKRPSGFFFRRRLPTAWGEIWNPGQKSALCLSLRSDVLSEATRRVRALTDLAVAVTTERPVNHLSAEHVTLLTELARCQIAAHEALRASATPRSEAAANFAAQTERATQDMLHRALALGDRTPVEDPLREMARLLGETLDETTADWRALAFEALRVMLDVSREREKREMGTYYNIPQDRSHIPPIGTFHDAGGYCGTLALELTHWTGAASRLDSFGRFADRKSYAFEELVAEIATAFYVPPWALPPTSSRAGPTSTAG